MIIVDVKIPTMEKVYNLSLDEKSKVTDLIEEIVELVIQKEGIQFDGILAEMVLCSIDKGLQCAGEHCLRDYGVGSGEELILI